MYHLDGQLLREILPAVFLFAGAMVCALVSILRPSTQAQWYRVALMICAVGSSAVAIVSILRLGSANVVGSGYDNQIYVDRFSIFYVLAVNFVVVICSWLVPWRSREMARPGAYHALLLTAAASVIVLAAATEFGTLLVALGILSVALAGLQSLPKTEPGVARAAWQQFLCSGLALLFLAFGAALLYGLSRSTQVDAWSAISGQSTLRAMAALFLLLGTVTVAGMPPLFTYFHPGDEAAIAGQRGFVISMSVMAAAALLFRIFIQGAGAATHTWTWTLALLAAATLAYSALGAWHAVTVRRLVAMAVLNQIAVTAAAFAGAVQLSGVSTALLALAATEAGILATAATLALVENAGLPGEISHWRGLGRRSPVAATLIALSLLCLSGLPPLVGFFSRFFVVQQMFGTGLAWLGLILVGSTLFLSMPILRLLGSMFGDSVEAAPFVLTRTPRDSRMVAGFAALVPLAMVFLLPQLSLVMGYAAAAAR